MATQNIIYGQICEKKTKIEKRRRSAARLPAKVSIPPLKAWHAAKLDKSIWQMDEINPPKIEAMRHRTKQVKSIRTGGSARIPRTPSESHHTKSVNSLAKQR